MKFILRNIKRIGFIIAFSPIIISILFGLPLLALSNCRSAGDHLVSCYILGVDFSDTLNALSFLHWFTFWTFPIGMFTILIGVIMRNKINKNN